MKARSTTGTILGIALTVFVTSTVHAVGPGSTTGGRGQTDTTQTAEQAREEAARRARTGVAPVQTNRDDRSSGGFAVPGQGGTSSAAPTTQSAISRIGQIAVDARGIMQVGLRQGRNLVTRSIQLLPGVTAAQMNRSVTLNLAEAGTGSQAVRNALPEACNSGSCTVTFGALATAVQDNASTLVDSTGVVADNSISTTEVTKAEETATNCGGRF